jgi:hypothetical protein
VHSKEMKDILKREAGNKIDPDELLTLKGFQKDILSVKISGLLHMHNSGVYFPDSNTQEAIEKVHYSI